MKYKPPRSAVRALILHEDRVLLVNAFAGQKSNLWCAPGGGVIAGHSLPQNLMREVFEETGLTIEVGAPALVNEFHDPTSGFHQVEVFFVVTRRRFFTRDELAYIRVKPAGLAQAAWGKDCQYDPLEEIVF
jgi:8-oxo-dGTP diphosphatase